MGGFTTESKNPHGKTSKFYTDLSVGCLEDAALLTLGTESQSMTTICTSPEARHPNTIAPPGRVAADGAIAQTPSQSLKVHTGLAVASVTTVGPVDHLASAVDPNAQHMQSLSDVDPNTSDAKKAIECDESLPGGPSKPATDSSLQTRLDSTPGPAPEHVVAPSPTPCGYGDTASTSRPFSARLNAIQHILSSVSSPGQKEPQVGVEGSTLRSQKHSAEPFSAATTPQPKRAKALKIASRRFACPFRKRNPFLYRRDLCKHGFTTISYVKQHLYRRHMTYICERCGHEFVTESELTNHQQQEEGCKFIPVENRPDPGGITPKQKALLHRRADGRPDEREQWGIVWRIAFPKYGHLEPSPYVDDSEKVDAVFNFAHTNGLDIAKTIPEMNDVPEAAIKTFIENIRNALMSSGEVEDIPPPMDSPGSDGSPQGEPIQEPLPEDPHPISVKDQFQQEKGKGMPMEGFSGAPTEGPMDGNTKEFLFNMPLDYNFFQPNEDGMYGFGSIPDMMALQFPSRAPSQHVFAGSTSLPQMGQMSVVDYFPMPQSSGCVPSTEPADQQGAGQGSSKQPRQEPS